MKNTWYSVKNELPNTGSVDIYIDNEIGEFGVSARSFLNELKQYQGQAINLHINSPGGSLVDAFAIYDYVKLKGFNITAQISGIAASAATVISAAAKTVTIGAHSYYYIHNPYYANQAGGPSTNLDKMKGSLLDIYQAKTGLERAQLSDMMDAETLLSAKEALQLGFVDGISKEAQVAAKLEQHIAQIPGADMQHIKGQIPQLAPKGIWQQVLNTLQNLEQKVLSEQANNQLEMELANGQTLTVINKANYAEVLPGDRVADAENGTLQLSNGETLEIKNGIIEHIFKQTQIMNNTEALSAQIEELVKQLQEVLAQMKPAKEQPAKDKEAEAEIENLTRELERIKARRLDVANHKVDADPDKATRQSENGWGYVSRYLQTQFR